MPRAIRTLLTAATVTGLLVPLTQTIAVQPATASSAAAAKPAARAGTPTPYALLGFGFATHVKGGKVPANSSPVASESIACTNLAGRSAENHVAEVALPGLGTVSGARTDVWTTRSGGTVSSWSRHRLGGVTLSDSPLGTLKVGAVTATAHAYHDARGFHAETDTELASLTFQPPVGPAVTLPIPAPNRPVTVPGVAKVSLATSFTRERSNRARAITHGVKVELIPTGTVVRIAHARAEIFAGARHGIFSGRAVGVTGKLLGGTASIGNLPLSRMPCQGTGGQLQTRKLLGGQLPSLLTADGAYTQQRTRQGAKRSRGFERAVVGSLKIGDALKIDAVVAQANVVRTRSGVRTSTKGTRLGSITVNGKRQDFPGLQPLEIPGVAKIEPNVVTKYKNGIQVVALRVTLLDSTGGTIDVGTAKLRIRRAAR